MTRYDRPEYSYTRWLGVNCGTRQQSIRGVRDPLTKPTCQADYVTVEWGLIIVNVRSIVKRIFSRGIIGTGLLIITSLFAGNKRNAERGDDGDARARKDGDRETQVCRP